METEEQLSIENKVVNRKIYDDRAVWRGGFLGGPIVAGYFIAENYKAFNQPQKATQTMAYSIIGTVLIFIGIFCIPNIDKVPNFLIPVSYTMIAYIFVKHYQAESIKAHIAAGGEVYVWWRSLGVALIGLLLTLPIIMVVALFTHFIVGNP